MPCDLTCSNQIYIGWALIQAVLYVSFFKDTFALWLKKVLNALKQQKWHDCPTQVNVFGQSKMNMMESQLNAGKWLNF